MDRTLNPVKRGNKRRRARNWKAWQLFSPDGDNCRFCPHGAADHLTSSGQPHFYRPAAEQDWRNSNEKLYRHELEDGSEVLVKRVTVASRAELLTAFCTACAKDKDTSQVLCFQRTLAKGEVVGLNNHHTNGNHTNGNHTNGNHANGNHTNGNHANGNHANGNHANGNHANGR